MAAYFILIQFHQIDDTGEKGGGGKEMTFHIGRLEKKYVSRDMWSCS